MSNKMFWSALAGGLTYLFLTSKESQDRVITLYGNPEKECPKATVDLKTNTINRNKAIKTKWIQYGPLNLADKAYWRRIARHWNTTVPVAMKSRCANCVAFDISPRMLDCIKAGQPSKRIEDAEGYLGYCWMHHFKCHSARSCYTWAAGGPITDDQDSYEWQSKTA
jgi:hypothetical protein